MYFTGSGTSIGIESEDIVSIKDRNGFRWEIHHQKDLKHIKDRSV